jgi:hypothetical protein
MPVPITCRFCRSTDGEIVLDAGLQPASDNFPAGSDPGPDPVHPLRMWLCERCHLAQLVEDPTVAEEPRGQEPEALVRQAEEAVAAMAAADLIGPGRTVIEYGSPHGGSWLEILARHGVEEGAPGEQVDVLVDNIGMMHDADQAAGLAERIGKLKPDGVLVFEFHSLAAIVAGGQWNALRHGHYAYYSIPALAGMLESVGWGVTTARWYPLYGGTVLLVARRNGRPDDTVLDLTARELDAGVLKADVVRSLQDAATVTARSLRRFLEDEAAAGRTVLGYSAASRSVALLNQAGAGPDLLAAIADASEPKQGRRLPGSGIAVISPREMVERKPDTVVLFVADLLPEVKAAMPEIEERGGRWVVADDVQA